MSADATRSDESKHEFTPKPADEQPQDGASRTEQPDGNIVGVSTLDTRMWQSYIGSTEKVLREETNATRRKNIQMCLDFIRKHGIPAKGYSIWVHNGVLKVLTDDEFRNQDYKSQREIHSLPEAYGLAAPRVARPTELE
ncbi:hypothetical protein N8I77_012162 [Diaporthe amygdali]|uniref:Uncharacterized protein n=1 Tax=Phomopsis amygdali TaxID=1214568 RepID=A0AAD9S5N1_PHOAM|nr:hypothetical protein N8I77_012162 [Diaporthe amygdali]